MTSWVEYKPLNDMHVSNYPNFGECFESSGQPSSSRTDENVGKVLQDIDEERDSLWVKMFVTFRAYHMVHANAFWPMIKHDADCSKICAPSAEWRPETKSNLQDQAKEEGSCLFKVFDIFLFSKTKIQLLAWRLEDIASLHAELQAVINSSTKLGLERCFQPWDKCWDWCINSEGPTLEGNIQTCNWDKPQIVTLSYSGNFWLQLPAFTTYFYCHIIHSHQVKKILRTSYKEDVYKEPMQ
jgi:hypothetical protein